MKKLIESHSHKIYLRPGEVVVAREPVLVSTVLGSCVAVTMFSPVSGVGAICHAMLPDNAGRDEDLRYVDTALRHIFRKVLEYGGGSDLVVKLFGGARVLDVGDGEPSRRTVGEQNVERALQVLDSLGLTVTSADTGGAVGRKLFFCTRDGDVYLRRMKHNK
ncbi:MAG: chemotaxis protein CheD [Desulfuromonadaceae bacterium]|nr:chemotaxis protein CheD [Desulfuromonadaceae bacterium]